MFGDIFNVDFSTLTSLPETNKEIKYTQAWLWIWVQFLVVDSICFRENKSIKGLILDCSNDYISKHWIGKILTWSWLKLGSFLAYMYS